MKLDVMPLGMLGTNCYLLSDDDKRLMIIDPGGEPEKVIAYIEKNSYIPFQIFCTHGHFDHVCAVADLHEKYKIPTFIHPEDLGLMSEAPLYSSAMGGSTCKKPVAEGYFEDGQTFTFGSATIQVLHTPGHSAGSVCLYIKDMSLVICGDTLFQNSIGRTDLPNSNPQAIYTSIISKLYTLPDDTVAYPGHGDTTTIGHEKHFNPFVRGNV